MKKPSPPSAKPNKPVTALVIPARWGSTRFPGKILHPIAGKPLVQHVWERSLLVKNVSRVLIATDDGRIARVARGFGAEVVMTSPSHPSGTDRIAEVASRFRGITHFVNVQGDEPLIDPLLIEKLVSMLTRNKETEMVTAATPFSDPREAKDSNSVKVVLGTSDRALYFSRAPIPFHRDAKDLAGRVAPLLHLGIYGYRRDILQKLVRLSPSPLECCEKLEQLRALENGISIRVIVTKHHGFGVDTPADARKAEKLLARSGKK